MKNIQTGYFFLIGFLLVVLGSCNNPPEFPVEPRITFKTVEQYHKKENGLDKDSLVIVLRFEDGDGDLGLSPNDVNAPYNQGSKFFHNYFTTLLVKQGTQFVPFQFPNPNFTFNGRFPLLNKDNRIEPLEGDLKYSIVVRSGSFNKGDVIKFQVRIADRALNESNTVETSEITLFQ